MKTYTHWEVLVKCEHCNKDNLGGHSDNYYPAIDRRNQLIESFGNKRVKIIKKTEIISSHLKKIK